MKKLLDLPPLAVCLLILTATFASMLFGAGERPSWAVLVLMWVAVIAQLAWAYGLYQAAGGNPRHRWVFLLAGISITLIWASFRLPHGLVGAPMAVYAPLIIAAGLSFGASLIIAARALVAAEGGADPHGNRTFFTFLALGYLFIGVWPLRRRLKMLQARTSAVA